MTMTPGEFHAELQTIAREVEDTSYQVMAGVFDRHAVARRLINTRERLLMLSSEYARQVGMTK